MKLVCAWCRETIDRPSYAHALESTTSHGMCAACSEALISQDRGRFLQEHLNTIPVPVVVVDSSSSFVTMNTKACEMLGQDLDAPEECLLGKVFDCVHSRSPEGCGRTVHCVGCVIRRSVVTTFKTGEPQVSVPATRSISSADDISEAVLDITTVRMGGMVLLRIE